MFKSKPQRIFSKGLCSLGIAAGLIGSFLGIDTISQRNTVLANQGFLEFQWDKSSTYKKLKYYQTSNGPMDRSTYYLFLRPSERKTGILKLSIKVPDSFDARLKPEKISLCKVKIGGYTERTKCVEELNADISVKGKQESIEILPETPIPANKSSYAVVMKMFNPRKRGMYQFQALTESTGDLPISLYLGTWNIGIQ